MFEHTYIVRFVKWSDDVERWEYVGRNTAEEQYTACLEDGNNRIVELIDRNGDIDTVIERKVFYHASPCCV